MFFASWRVDRVVVVLPGGDLERRSASAWRNKSAFLPLPVRRRRVVGGVVRPAVGSCLFGAPRSADLRGFGCPRVDGGAAPPSALCGILVPPPCCCRRAVSSSGALGGVRGCGGGLFQAADGEAVAASAAVDFVPGLFLRVTWRCSVAGDEFFGYLYRSLPRSVLAGGCELGAGCVQEEDGSGGCSPLDGAAAQLRQVRGSSPADALQPASSRRPRARRVSLEVLQNMVLARSWDRWWFVFFVFVPCWCSGGGDGLVRRAVLSLLLPALLFLCLFSALGQSVCEPVSVCVLRSIL